MHKKTLPDGWEIWFVMNDAGEAMHVSAHKGDYRVHRSLSDSYTAYRVNPFRRVGIFQTSQAAMQACEEQI